MSQQKVNLVKELLCEMHGVYHIVITYLLLAVLKVLCCAQLFLFPGFLFFLLYTFHYLPMVQGESLLWVRRWCCQNKKRKSLSSFHLMFLYCGNASAESCQDTKMAEGGGEVGRSPISRQGREIPAIG